MDLCGDRMLQLLLLLSLTVAEGSWQPASSTGASRDLDLSPSMFAPGGRLFSVERMAQVAMDKDDVSNNVVAAITCQNGGIVVLSSSIESPYLPRNLTATREGNDDDVDGNNNETEAVFLPLDLPTTGVPRPPFLRLSKNLWAVTAGNSVDSQLLRLKLHQLAELAREQDLGDRADILARRLADQLQLSTQSDRHGRILAAYAVIFDGNEMWRVDPTGQFWKCAAVVIGRGSASAETQLLTLLQEQADTGQDSTEGLMNSLTQETARHIATTVITDALKAGESSKDKEDDKSKAPKGRTALTGMSLSGGTVSWYSDSDLR